MAYEMVMPYHLHMPSYFLETFTEYPLVNPVDGEEKTYIFSYPLTGEDVPGFNPLDLAELK